MVVRYFKLTVTLFRLCVCLRLLGPVYIAWEFSGTTYSLVTWALGSVRRPGDIAYSSPLCTVSFIRVNIFNCGSTRLRTSNLKYYYKTKTKRYVANVMPDKHAQCNLTLTASRLPCPWRPLQRHPLFSSSIYHHPNRPTLPVPWQPPPASNPLQRKNTILSVPTHAAPTIRTLGSLAFKLVLIVSLVAHIVIRSTSQILTGIRPIISTLLGTALLRDEVLWVCLEFRLGFGFLLGVALQANRR